MTTLTTLNDVIEKITPSYVDIDRVFDKMLFINHNYYPKPWLCLEKHNQPIQAVAYLNNHEAIIITSRLACDSYDTKDILPEDFQYSLMGFIIMGPATYTGRTYEPITRYETQLLRVYEAVRLIEKIKSKQQSKSYKLNLKSPYKTFYKRDSLKPPIFSITANLSFAALKNRHEEVRIDFIEKQDGRLFSILTPTRFPSNFSLTIQNITLSNVKQLIELGRCSIDKLGGYVTTDFEIEVPDFIKKKITTTLVKNKFMKNQEEKECELVNF